MVNVHDLNNCMIVIKHKAKCSCNCINNNENLLSGKVTNEFVPSHSMGNVTAVTIYGGAKLGEFTPLKKPLLVESPQ